MATQLTSGLVAKLQQALWKAGFFPGVINQVFDDNTVERLEAYWDSKGWSRPNSAADATALLQRSFLNENNIQDPSFTLAEMTVIGQAYAEKRGLGAGGWFKKNWKWLAGGAAVVVVGVGGYIWWRRSSSPAYGELGCGCGAPLGHSGRVTMYQFPSGAKRGHYQRSTGRFHQH